MVDFDQIGSVQSRTALFTLVAICFFVAAFWQVPTQNGLLRTDQPLRHTGCLFDKIPFHTTL
jgi:hypothetical protein